MLATEETAKELMMSKSSEDLMFLWSGIYLMCISLMRWKGKGYCIIPIVSPPDHSVGSRSDFRQKCVTLWCGEKGKVIVPLPLYGQWGRGLTSGNDAVGLGSRPLPPREVWNPGYDAMYLLNGEHRHRQCILLRRWGGLGGKGWGGRGCILK